MIVDFPDLYERLEALPKPPRVLVVTSCTGMKRQPPRGLHPLVLGDLRGDKELLAKKRAALEPYRCAAEDLYTGQQHVRLMRGVRAFRATAEVDLRIVSAGYGVLRADALIPPYDATFANMTGTELRTWADELGIPTQMRGLMTRSDDLKIVCLASSYLEAMNYDFESLGGTTVVLCSHRYAEQLPKADGLFAVALGNVEAKRFRASVVTLKGELASRLLFLLANGTASTKVAE
jgi:hypothetical protein